MALLERTVIDRIEVLEGGILQVRRRTEVYDDAVAAKSARRAEGKFHRSVISKEAQTPPDVQAFLDASKAPK